MQAARLFGIEVFAAGVYHTMLQIAPHPYFGLVAAQDAKHEAAHQGRIADV